MAELERDQTCEKGRKVSTTANKRRERKECTALPLLFLEELALRKAKHRLRHRRNLRHNSNFLRPVAVRVPRAKEGEIGRGFEVGGVAFVDFSNDEDRRVFSFDVEAEAVLRGKSMSAQRMKVS